MKGANFNMNSQKPTLQVRKGDPLAKLNSRKSSNSDAFSSASNHSIGYKLNTRIRALRTSKGWSQTELGEKLANYMNLNSKIPTSTIASWEHRDPSLAKIPSPDKIEALAALFKVTTDYLKGLSDDPKRTAIEFACAVSPSALANFSISVCISSNALLEYEIILDFLIKSSTLSGEKNFAVPLVGST